MVERDEDGCYGERWDSSGPVEKLLESWKQQHTLARSCSCGGEQSRICTFVHVIPTNFSFCYLQGSSSSHRCSPGAPSLLPGDAVSQSCCVLLTVVGLSASFFFLNLQTALISYNEAVHEVSSGTPGFDRLVLEDVSLFKTY